MAENASEKNGSRHGRGKRAGCAPFWDLFSTIVSIGQSPKWPNMALVLTVAVVAGKTDKHAAVEAVHIPAAQCYQANVLLVRQCVPSLSESEPTPKGRSPSHQGQEESPF